MRALHRAWIGASIVAVAMLGAQAHAQNFFDGDTSNPGDWNDPANWDNDTLPGVGNNSVVGDSATVPVATAEITGALTNPNINDLRVGATAVGGADGTVNHSSGSLTVSGWAFIGVDGPAGNGNMGTYNLSGDAEFIIDPAANNGEQEFHVGAFGGAGESTGVVNVSDDALLSIQRGYIGSNDGNSGTLNQSGGRVNVNTWMSIGRDTGAVGEYNMTGGELSGFTDGLTIGESNGAQGTLNVSGSSVVSTNLLSVGRFGGGAVGELSIAGSAASVSASGNVNIGGDSLAPTDATGILNFTADAAGVTPLIAGADVFLNDGAGLGSALLTVDMSLAPAGDILLIDVGGSLLGTFAGLPQGAIVPGSGGRRITYQYGDGNDVALVPEPTALVMLLTGGVACLVRRRV